MVLTQFVYNLLEELFKNVNHFINFHVYFWNKLPC